MSAREQYTEYILELLQPIYLLRTKRMFGGIGIWSDTAHFALIMGNCLYFTVDEITRKKYALAGMSPFSYHTKKGRILVQSYFEVPEDILTHTQALKLWANESIQVAKNKIKKNRNNV